MATTPVGNSPAAPSEKQAPRPASPLNIGGDGAATKTNAIEIPQITLPKGGGALKGIDEKFQVNPSNGTASFSIPLPVTPGRGGFQPALALSYNSGAGNSICGIGWSLELPAIQRKTDKKLPRYFDDVEEDVFMFSGAEDLVPVLNEAAEQVEELTPGGAFKVRRYRPRIEGLFAKIERVEPLAGGGFYWKVTTKENIVTFFGKSPSHRLAAPGEPRKVFKWLPEISFDDKGNVMVFHFEAESKEGVENTLPERNRFLGIQPFANLHLKSVRYGNEQPYYPNYGNQASGYNWNNIYEPPQPAGHFLFELILDYGEHGHLPSASNGSVEIYRQKRRSRFARRDAFSDCRPGFEIRTYRLCQRALMFHHFTGEEFGFQGVETPYLPCLVSSLDLNYRESGSLGGQMPELNYLESITRRGYIREEAGEERYRFQSLPPMTFEYEELRWNTSIQAPPADSLIHAPAGLSSGYQWVDFYGEGISGILTEQAESWFYKENLGNGNFSPARLIAPKPSFTGISNGTLQLQDLEADGRKQVVVNTPGLQGYFEMTDENDWLPFRAFEQIPNLDLRDPNLKMLDLDGDGQPDLLISEENVFTWYASAGVKGYDSPELAAKPFDEERGAALLFADSTQSVFLADMSGDGLTDILRIRNGEVCYWQNLGYGRFGAKISMRNAPVFDHPDAFNPGYLHLADVSGTGTTDLLYLGKNRFRAWLNLSGNAWSNAQEIDPFPDTAQPNQLSVVDFLGNGTACIVWSSPLPQHVGAPLRYIDLMSGKKPHIMTAQRNGFGKVTSVEYLSSTTFYLADKASGNPWMTKLHFPVQCVSKVTVRDEVTGIRFTNSHTYHHGYYDHAEREFRGFGKVEQTDTETWEELSAAGGSNMPEEHHYEPPVLTKTWFHTGAFLDGKKILEQFSGEYFRDEYQLPDAVLPPGLSPSESREALRACKGMTLRQEIYSLDGSEKQSLPYSAAAHNCRVERLQVKAGNRHAVFLVLESEALTFNYERDTPLRGGAGGVNDPRIAHTFNLEVDRFGNVTRSASVVYGRKTRPPGLPGIVWQEQEKRHVLLTEADFTNEIDEAGAWRLPLPAEVRTFEWKGLQLATGENFFQLATLRAAAAAAPELPYHEKNTPVGKRLIEKIRTRYRSNDLANPLPARSLESLALPWESYQLAFTPELLDELYGEKLPAALRPEILGGQGKYEDFDSDGNWWISSGKPVFPADAREHFYLPTAYEDPFETLTTVRYYPRYDLLPQEMEDALGNVTRVARYNFRTLSPELVRDPNGNFAEAVSDALGLVAGTAVLGKITGGSNPLEGAGGGESGDSLAGFSAMSEAALLQAFFENPRPAQPANVPTPAHLLLGNATARMVYDFDHIPARVATIAKEKHTAQLAPGELPNLQISLEYSDGMGNVALKKVQAEPGDAPCRDAQGILIKDENGNLAQCPTNTRWIGNGRTILNNKGKPIRQYEPYFSGTAAYETEPELRETGVSPELFYDPVGRLVKTIFPDGTLARTEFDAWSQQVFDQNDTVLESDWYLTVTGEITDSNHPRYVRWFDTIKNDADQVARYRRAAQQAAVHANTSNVVYADSLGRPFYSVAHHKWELPIDSHVESGEEFHITRVVTDIKGNQREVWDARGNCVMRYNFDMLGHQVWQDSMDGGQRWLLNDCMGKPLLAWDLNERQISASETVLEHRVFSTEYDVLHRPLELWMTVNGAARQCIGRFSYGESLAGEATGHNLRGQLYEKYDAGGLLRNERFDFKGSLLEVRRQLAADYQNPVTDWQGDLAAQLEPEVFTQITEYDSLNRMSRLYNWHRGEGSRVAVYEPNYNERGLLQSENLFVRALKIATGYTGGTRVEAIRRIEYDVKGQRTSLRLGNGTVTRYHYDSFTFRLTRLFTSPPGGADPNAAWHQGGALQDLRYAYNPVGNITEIHDEAQTTTYFKNQAVLPQNRYVYDSLYRLIHAVGRENYHSTGAPGQFEPAPMTPVFPVSDARALRTYRQRYTYDPAGNILKMKHTAAGGYWTRYYAYDSNSNRLLETCLQEAFDELPDTRPCEPAHKTHYHYDTHGNMLNLANVAASQYMRWDYRDMISALDLQGGGWAYYQYDSDKQRTRKVLEKTGGIREERWYLGGLEWYRRFEGERLVEEIETLHLFDGEQRVLIVEDVLETNNAQLRKGILYRYQYSNHLGSVGLELNEQAVPISYEEYHPYGTTAYRSNNIDLRMAAKRYRYTGMERDEETGLNYHAARYYTVWLGRWVSCDPIGIKGGRNFYSYGNNNPIIFTDSTGLIIESSTIQIQDHHTNGQNTPHEISGEEQARIIGLNIRASLRNDENVNEQRYFETSGQNQVLTEIGERQWEAYQRWRSSNPDAPNSDYRGLTPQAIMWMSMIKNQEHTFDIHPINMETLPGWASDRLEGIRISTTSDRAFTITGDNGLNVTPQLGQHGDLNNQGETLVSSEVSSRARVHTMPSSGQQGISQLFYLYNQIGLQPSVVIQAHEAFHAWDAITNYEERGDPGFAAHPDINRDMFLMLRRVVVDAFINGTLDGDRAAILEFYERGFNYDNPVVSPPPETNWYSSAHRILDASISAAIHGAIRGLLRRH